MVWWGLESTGPATYLMGWCPALPVDGRWRGGRGAAAPQAAMGGGWPRPGGSHFYGAATSTMETWQLMSALKCAGVCVTRYLSSEDGVPMMRVVSLLSAGGAEWAACPQAGGWWEQAGRPGAAPASQTRPVTGPTPAQWPPPPPASTQPPHSLHTASWCRGPAPAPSHRHTRRSRWESAVTLSIFHVFSGHWGGRISDLWHSEVRPC